MLAIDSAVTRRVNVYFSLKKQYEEKMEQVEREDSICPSLSPILPGCVLSSKPGAWMLGRVNGSLDVVI